MYSVLKNDTGHRVNIVMVFLEVIILFRNATKRCVILSVTAFD